MILGTEVAATKPVAGVVSAEILRMVCALAGARMSVWDLSVCRLVWFGLATVRLGCDVADDVWGWVVVPDDRVKPSMLAGRLVGLAAVLV